MTNLDRANPVDDGFIDRVVDGDLTPGELRAAIDRLDREPDGWKRCALAFLEDQCWRDSLRTFGSDAKSSIAVRSSNNASAAARAKLTRRWPRAAMSAGIVAASFVFGWLGHAALQPPGTALTAMAQRSATAPDPLDGEGADHDGAAPAGPRIPGPSDFSDVIRTVGRLRLGPERDGAEVPILAGPGIDEEWLKNQPPPLTEHGQVALQRRGYQVDQTRRLVTTTLADGRRVAIPIDQVQIRYTGNNPL